jgi:hypothetical protein
VLSPFSDHVTIVSLEGEDWEGFCFSIGSACRESLSQSWEKSLLEAVQGRHYVRHLKTNPSLCDRVHRGELPDFPEHALYYSLHPERLAETVLHRGKPPAGQTDPGLEGLGVLLDRLGRDRPVLFRNLTPPPIAQGSRDWYVVRVLLPGLQPLHGNQQFPHLGGPLWAPRGLADWAAVPPHPFP